MNIIKCFNRKLTTKKHIFHTSRKAYKPYNDTNRKFRSIKVNNKKSLTFLNQESLKQPYGMFQDKSQENKHYILQFSSWLLSASINIKKRLKEISNKKPISCRRLRCRKSYQIETRETMMQLCTFISWCRGGKKSDMAISFLGLAEVIATLRWTESLNHNFRTWMFSD
jgi:hypothetical protein